MNPKRQRFCEEYAIDLNGAQAAIRAGYAPGSAKVTASRLLTDDNVRQRVDELIVEYRERVDVSLDSLTEFLREDRRLAHKLGQAGAAVSATEKIAKIHGYMKERIQVDVNVNVSQMSDAEYYAELHDIDRGCMESFGRQWAERKIEYWKKMLAIFDSGEIKYDNTESLVVLPAFEFGEVLPEESVPAAPIARPRPEPA